MAQRRFGNVFVDCNDLGVSCVGSAGQSIRNVQIKANAFRGVVGGGYIYVGSDGVEGENPDVSDVDIDDNQCSGAIGTQFAHGAIVGIIVSLGRRNQRIRMRGNRVTNDNPDVSAALVSAMRVFLRQGESEFTEDLEASGNVVDFRSNDTMAGLEIAGPNITGLRAFENTVRAGSRGMAIDSASGRVHRNDVYGATSAGIDIATTHNAIAHLDVERNFLQAAAAFKPAVLFRGPNALARATLERNRLESPDFSIISAMAAPLGFTMHRNSVNAPKHASAVPSEETGTVVE